MPITRDPGQGWDPQGYARHGGFVARYGEDLFDLLKPRRDERILDLGCGNGTLTRKLADLGCTVVGIDASPDQIGAARALGLDARVMDAQDLSFDAEFDAVFSNAALHWMPDQGAVLAGAFRALRPGGRFVAEMGGAGNVATLRAALIEALDRHGLDGAAADPWTFPTEAEQRARLEAVGFAVAGMWLFPRPTDLPDDIRGWLETFARSFLAPVPEADRPAFLDRIAAAVAPRLRKADGGWQADYVRLRFVASKPAP